MCLTYHIPLTHSPHSLLQQHVHTVRSLLWLHRGDWLLRNDPQTLRKPRLWLNHVLGLGYSSWATFFNQHYWPHLKYTCVNYTCVHFATPQTPFTVILCRRVLIVPRQEAINLKVVCFEQSPLLMFKYSEYLLWGKEQSHNSTHRMTAAGSFLLELTCTPCIDWIEMER